MNSAILSDATSLELRSSSSESVSSHRRHPDTVANSPFEEMVSEHPFAEFLQALPPVDYAFAYGSAAFQQKGRPAAVQALVSSSAQHRSTGSPTGDHMLLLLREKSHCTAPLASGVCRTKAYLSGLPLLPVAQDSTSSWENRVPYCALDLSRGPWWTTYWLWSLRKSGTRT